MPSNDGDKDEIRKAENVVKMKLRVVVIFVGGRYEMCDDEGKW